MFKQAKDIVSSDRVLVHYQADKKLYLRVDASPYGLGAVLCHKIDGIYKPIAFASRTLTQAEKNYAQIEKEALAIIVGVKRFNNYLYGRPFTLITDHKPLARIFGPKSNIPPLAAARMQRWALFLAGYNYEIQHVKSEDNAEADCLSRLPCPETGDHSEDDFLCYVFMEELPVTAMKIAAATKQDVVLAKVFHLTSTGWPSVCADPEIKPYFSRRNEISIEDGCLLWGSRVIVPLKLQSRLMEELHECHPGVCKMKALSRAYIWWPQIDEQIEVMVHKCVDCTNAQNIPRENPLLLWPWATQPWQRIHIDYLDVDNRMFLLVVDSYSKWMEVYHMHSTTAAATINKLRILFASYGLPRHLVSDNGPQFVAEEFKLFLKVNGIRQTLTPPYHPSSNGLAERHVQTFKRIFKKLQGDPVEVRIARVLFAYRNLPHRTTGHTPAELFLQRPPRTKLSLVQPDIKARVEGLQQKSKEYHDRGHTVRRFERFQRVQVRNYRGSAKWVSGTIVEATGPATYLVRIAGNDRRLVHVDQLIPDESVENAVTVPHEWEPFMDPPDESHSEVELSASGPPPNVRVRNSPLRKTPEPVSAAVGEPLPPGSPHTTVMPERSSSVSTPQTLSIPRRSQRTHKAPIRLDL